MPASAIEPPVDVWAPTEAETVALAYLREAGQDRWTALVRLAQDALTDLESAEAIIRERGRQISHGYVRAAPR
ncbi:hypothetical protein [Methylobacterium aerolatum]|uniref:Uncharacterized protein n=1 Tax=Methylobacterium aerolatum TaxID=418708 RepID=A0ABU0I3R9_9HYPH|nr:hypothetical protein [Methylobacterium aerolatum]MDQ0449258.1 hypothetical protein [Methylobacterium aerolatum]GJD35442.1 hypothetical protein FMGBMHLM_2352 [Methylobacterium aerolatum]